MANQPSIKHHFASLLVEPFTGGKASAAMVDPEWRATSPTAGPSWDTVRENIRLEREACISDIEAEIEGLDKIKRLSPEERDTARELLTFALNRIRARGGK